MPYEKRISIAGVVNVEVRPQLFLARLSPNGQAQGTFVYTAFAGGYYFKGEESENFLEAIGTKPYPEEHPKRLRRHITAPTKQELTNKLALIREYFITPPRHVVLKKRRDIWPREWEKETIEETALFTRKTLPSLRYETLLEFEEKSYRRGRQEGLMTHYWFEIFQAKLTHKSKARITTKIKAESRKTSQPPKIKLLTLEEISQGETKEGITIYQPFQRFISRND